MEEFLKYVTSSKLKLVDTHDRSLTLSIIYRLDHVDYYREYDEDTRHNISFEAMDFDGDNDKCWAIFYLRSRSPESWDEMKKWIATSIIQE